MSSTRPLYPPAFFVLAWSSWLLQVDCLTYRRRELAPSVNAIQDWIGQADLDDGR